MKSRREIFDERRMILMKKKLISLLMAMTLTLSLAGCEKTASVSGSASSEGSSTSTETSVSSSASEEKGDDLSDAGEAYPVTALYNMNVEENTVYLVKGEESVGSFAAPKEAYPDNCFFYGDYLFYSSYEDGAEEGNKYAYKALNYKTGEEKTLTHGDWGGFYDFYKGKIVLTVKNYYKGEYVELFYDPTSLAEVDNPSKLWESLPYDTASVFQSMQYATAGGRKCASRVMDEVGYIRVNEGYDYYNFDGEALNKFDELKEGYDYSYIEYYDDKCVIYRACNYQAGENVLRCLNLVTGQDTVICENVLSGIDMSIDRDLIYFIQDESDKFGVTGQTLWVYNPKDETKNKVMTAEGYAGSNGLSPFNNLVVSGDAIYVRNSDGTSEDWCIIKDGEFKQLNINKKTYDWAQYGTVEYFSSSELCEFCKNPIYEEYEEYFVLDESLGAGVAAINNTLKEDAKERMGSRDDEAQSVSSAEECENAAHGTPMGDITYERRISNVKILKDYVVINENSYWYGGGAHGMPYEYCRLFNLTTGDEVTIKDIYSGTEEDFKKAVAENIKTQYNSYTEDNTPFFMFDSADAIYEEVYNSVTFDGYTIEFDKDCLNVVFPPYELAAYASGFIYATLTYDELGITAFK